MPLTGDGVATTARSKVNIPYFFGVKMQILDEDTITKLNLLYPKVVTKRFISFARKNEQVGAINTDDSGLVSNCLGIFRNLSSPQLYQQAYMRLPISTYKDWADGVVCWNKKQQVGIFFKEGTQYYVVRARKCIEGVIVDKFIKSQWDAGLTFFGVKYIYTKNLSSKGDWRRFNPYTEPTYNLNIGCKGESVRWLQYELKECGYNLLATGDFDKKTEDAVKDFQKHSLLVISGICDRQTKKYLSGS